MAQNIIYYKNNQLQIRDIRAHGNVLLQRIKLLETKLNRLKQRGEQQCQRDIIALNKMVSKMLQMLAHIHILEVTNNCYIGKGVFTQMLNKRFNELNYQFRRRLMWKRKLAQNLQKRPVHFNVL